MAEGQTQGGSKSSGPGEEHGVNANGLKLNGVGIWHLVHSNERPGGWAAACCGERGRRTVDVNVNGKRDTGWAWVWAVRMRYVRGDHVTTELQLPDQGHRAREGEECFGEHARWQTGCPVGRY
jgi:hypothetical protein